MKLIPLLLCTMLPFVVIGQCDYKRLINEGKHFAKNREYKKALYKYNSARRCNPSKGDEVDAAIEALLNQVEGEKKTADQERERALAEQKKADEKTVVAQKALASAEKALSELNLEQEKNRRIISLFYFYDDKIALAVKNGKYGYIDKNGNILIGLKYNQATPFNTRGFAKVTKDSLSMLIDTLGREYLLAENISELDSNITALDLSNQGWKYFPPILNNPQLEVLFLNGNNLDFLPKEIKVLNKLRYLDVSKNNLTELPEEIGQLSNLETLDISSSRPKWAKPPPDSEDVIELKPEKSRSNYFNSFPEHLMQLHKLKYLSMNYCTSLSSYQYIKKRLPNCKVNWQSRVFRD